MVINSLSNSDVQGPEPFLLLANKHYIRKISLDGSRYELLARGFDNVVSMDIDTVENKAYLLDSGKMRIYRIGLDQLNSPVSDYQQIVRHNVFGIEGFAVDWIGRKLYSLNRQDRSLRNQTLLFWHLNAKSFRRLRVGWTFLSHTYQRSNRSAKGNCRSPKTRLSVLQRVVPAAVYRQGGNGRDTATRNRRPSR